MDAHLRVLDAVGASLDASPCGAGKTIIACETAKRYGIPVAVICPKSVVAKWSLTLEAFGLEPLFVLNPEKLRGGRTPWLIVGKAVKRSGKETKTAKWNIPTGTLLIFDEVHNYGGYDSLNSKLLLSALGQKVLMLSATATESPLKMKAIGTQLRLFFPSQYWNWMKSMGVEQQPWGGLEWNAFSPANKSKMARMHESVFGPRGYRVPTEVLKDQLPELTVSDEPISISDKDKKKLNELYAEIEKHKSELTNMEERQLIELIKIPYLIERAQEIQSDGGSVVLFLNFTESVNRAAELLGCKIIDGKHSQEERLQAQAEFQRGDTSCLVVQIQAGGQSIDLHDTTGEHPRTALICPQYSGVMEEQAIGRISRVGAKSPALALRLYVPGTVERDALHTTQHKRQNTKIFNEGTQPMKTETPALEVVERAHAEHSPSSWKEKAKCCGFRNDNTRPKQAADRGTLGHEAVEKENPDMIPLDDPFLKDAVINCLKYLAHIRSKALGRYEEIREKKYPMLDQFGYIDHLFIHNGGRNGELVDYKFAWGEYEADSPQFWGYALGIFKEYEKMDTLTVHVLLPFKNEIDTVTWSRSQLDDLAAKSLAIVESAKRDDPTHYVTGDHCQWCVKRGGACPKLDAIALAIASKYKPDELALPEDFDPSVITVPERMALVKRAAPILESYASKANARALEMRLQEGIEIPGWELAEKSAPFRITDAQSAWEVVKGKITPEAFAACADVKIGELEKAVARVAERGQMGKAKEELRDRLLDANAAKIDGTIPYLKKVKSY